MFSYVATSELPMPIRVVFINPVGHKAETKTNRCKSEMETWLVKEGELVGEEEDK